MIVVYIFGGIMSIIIMFMIGIFVDQLFSKPKVEEKKEDDPWKLHKEKVDREHQERLKKIESKKMSTRLKQTMLTTIRLENKSQAEKDADRAFLESL